MANYIPGLISLTLITLVVDIVIRTLQRWPHNRHSTTTIVSPQQEIHTLAHDLAVKIERVQDDLGDLEHHLTLQHIQQEEAEVARMIDSMYISFVHPKPRLAICTRSSPFARSSRRRRLSSLCDGYSINALDTSRMSSPFTTFCERLLAMNRIWKQEKQLKKLQSDVQSAETSRQTSTFNAFCNLLVLQNKVWRLEKQVIDLEIEEEKLKKRFEATVRRAAKKMMEELHHHRLVEERVKGMITELDSCKLALEFQHALHEHELQEFTWEWYRDYLKLAREVERLKLAQQARCIEQELQTEYEDSLCEDFKAAQRRVEELETRLEGYQHTLVDAPIDDCDGITEVDNDSTSISSFTCVSTSYSGRQTSMSTRKGPSLLPCKIRPIWTRSLKREVAPWSKRYNLVEHAGFSFNPLFYGSNVSPLVLKARRPFAGLLNEGGVTSESQPITKKLRTSKATVVRWRI